MRKSLFFAVFTIILSMAGLAQNGKISYQAVVRNSANQLVHDQDLDVTVGIANSETGTAVYTETHAVHSNANGLISLLIGDGTPVAGSNWDAIQWNHAWVTAVVSQGGTELATHHLPLSAVPYALYADQVDPVALANYLTANHYLTEEVQVLSVSNDTLYLTGGSWVKLPQGFSGNYNDLTNKPTNVSTFNNDAGYLTKDSAVITNLQGDVTTLNTNVAQLQEATRKDALCDSVEACVKGWISDSTRMVYDSLHTYYATTDALKDSLTRYVSKEKLNDTLGHYLQADDLCDSIVKCDVIRNLRDSVQNNTENITNNTTNITNITNNITNYVTNLQGADSVLAERLAADSTNLADNYYNKTDIDDTLSHYLQAGDLCDSIVKCDVIQNMRDSIRTNASDIKSLQNADAALSARITADSTNLAGNYYNKTSIKDTLSHYLMHEEQMLSIGHDTIYLSGGSFVKLPAGFGGSYHDLVDTPTNVSAFTNDAGYLTSFTEQQMLSISNDTIYLTGGSFVKLPAGFSGNYNDLTNKPDLGQYATNEHLNDTLNNYYTQTQIGDTLNNYYTQTQIKDTLSHYLQAGDLCDSIVKCDVVRTMRDSIQINASNITDNIAALLNADSILAARILSDSVLFHQADSILMTRILNDSILTHNTDSILAVRILNDSILSHQADSVLFARIIADSTNLADYYYTNTQINDTLSHYLQAGDLCDSIVKCDVIQNMRDSIRTNASDITSLQNADAALSARITADSTNLAGNYYNKTSIKDTLSHYLMHEEQMLSIGHDTIYLSGGSFVKLPAGFGGSYHDLVDTPTNVSAFTNDAGYLTSFTEQQMLSISNDTIYLTGGSFVKLPAGFSGNYNDLTNKPDLGQYATNEHLNDTLNNYYTQEQIRDTLNNYYTQTQIKDTLSHYLQVGDLCDSIVKCDIVRTLRDSIQIMFDSIGSMHDSIFVNTTNITNNTENITTITNNVNNITTDIHALDSVISARIIRDSTELSNRMDTLLTHVCDSVETCVKGWISDSTRMIVDSLGAYYDTTLMKKAIHDTADVLRGMMTDAANDAKITIQKNGGDVGYFTVNQETDQAINILVPTTVAEMTDASNYVTHTQLNDTLGAYYDTTAVRTVIHDSLGNYQIKDCADVTNCVNTALADGTSATNRAIDSIAANVIHDSIVSNIQPSITETIHDSIVSNIQTNINTTIHDSIVNNIQTNINTTIHDSIVNNISGQIRDTVRNAIHDSLDNYQIKDCTDVTNCVNAALADGTSATNRAIDSIAANVIHDSIVSHIQPSITETIHDSIVNNIQTNINTTIHDSIVNNIQTNITETIHDSIVNNISGQIRDTVRNAIHDSLDNYQIKDCTDVTNCVNTALADGTSATNRAIDSIAANVIHDSIVSNIQPSITETIHDSIVNNIQTNINTTIHDSIVNNIQTNINTTIHDSIVNNISGQIRDTVRNAIHDSLGNYQIKDCADVTNCVNTALADGTSATNRAIDSIAANVIHDSIVSNIQTNITETIHDSIVNNIQTNINTTIHDSIVSNIQTNINTTIHDSIVNNISGQIRDTVRNAIHDSLGNYQIKDCTDVTNCVNTALADGTSATNRAIDSIAANVIHDSIVSNIQPSITETIHDSIVSNIQTNINTTIHDSIVNNISGQIRDTVRNAIHDSLGNYLTISGLCDSVMNCDGIETMQTNITNLQTADNNLSNRIKADSTNLKTNYYTRTQVDSTADKVRSEIGKGKLTIQYGTNPAVEFGANQDTTTTVTIPTPPEPTYGTLTIKKNNEPVGTFTANETKEININVPTCDSLAECDLIKSILARLDRLERQNDSLARELDKMKPLLTLAGPQKDTVCAGSTKSVTYTATFHNCSSSDYTLAWKVNGTDSSNVTGSRLILNVETAGQYKVVCIATRSDSTFVTDTVTTIVTVDHDIPTFDTTVSKLTVELSNITNTATIQWDTDSLPVACTGTSATKTYSVADTVTITATSERGCTLSKQVVLKPTEPAVTTDSIPTATIAATTAIAYGTVTSDGGIPSTKRGVVYDTSSTNLKLGAEGVDSVMKGTGKGNFACTLERLVPCTQYYVRAFAMNEVDTVYGEVKTFTTPSFTCGSTLYDIDGNDYATLLLGSQCWMKQNLRTTRYANGETIPLSTSTVGTTLPYRYEPDSNLTTYGYFYNWYAAMGGSSSSAANPSGVQGVCPDGWHLPSDAEWTQLTDFVSSYDNGVYVCGSDPTNIGKSMVSQQGWPESGVGCNIGNTVATNNSTQFSIPSAGTWDCGGGVGTNGVGYSNNGHAIFLSATENDDPTYSVYCREFYYMEAIAEKTAPHKTFGRSVRCVLDCATGHTYQPTVSAVSLTHTGTTVSMAASVVSDGGAEVTARGVCWSDSQHPTISSTHKVASGTGIGNFAVTEDLIPGATYYVRAYATNSEGTAYGAEVTYVVPNPMYPPTVNTGSKFLALTEGFEGSTLPSTWTTIDHDGDGYTWYRSSNNPHNNSSGCATSDSYHFIDDNTSPWLSPNNYLISPDITIPSDISPNLTFWYSGYNERFLVKVGSAGASSVGDFNTQVFGATTSNTGSYSQATVDLSSYAGQTFRLAFVHNGYYGNYQLYIDDIEVGEAGAIVSDITATTALCGGFVTDDGGATVTARGVCWSTSQNPTVSDSHTTDGSGTGSFTSNITGLNPLTTYYVRAYATNSAGTSYGSQVSFKTTEALAKVTTSVVSDVTIDNTTLSATCGGNVTDIGAYAVTARGVCWGTSTNPTISDSHTTDGSGLGSFTSNITGLTGGTYYVRAYATNSAGTAYGNQVSFTLPTVDAKSCSSAPVATDHEGNMYATVQIGTQCWMRENLRTTTSPKTGTKLALPARNSAGNVYSSLGSKVAHWYMNDSTTYAPKGYGLLYNWCAAMDTASPTTATATYMEVPTPSNINGNNTSYAFHLSDPHRGICPAGWHVPSYQDWNNLKTTISEAGKLAGGNDWESSSNATAPGNYDYADRNDSKFTALPVGKFNNYNCDRATTYAYFWCSMQMGDPTNARCLYMTHSGNTSTISYDGVSQGMSVRCVKD